VELLELVEFLKRVELKVLELLEFMNLFRERTQWRLRAEPWWWRPRLAW
jgi:hypothetical protein